MNPFRGGRLGRQEGFMQAWQRREEGKSEQAKVEVEAESFQWTPRFDSTM